MDKSDIISKLKENKYSFKDNGDQIVIKLARRYFFNLYFENNTVVKNEDIHKQFSWTNGRSLKAEIKIGLIGYLIFILLFALGCVLDPYFFSSGGKYFFIVITPIILFQLFEFWNYNKRLSKIKKLLNLND